ncbi:MAG: hypothetical protein OHK0053_06760 [Microscillaceae bacterium]
MILSNNNIRGELGKSMKLDEYSHVEKPFLEQLAGLGWEVLELKMQQEPGQSFRTSFSEVVLKPKLREALVKINPFLTPAQVDELESKITTFQKITCWKTTNRSLHSLLENPKEFVSGETMM